MLDQYLALLADDPVRPGTLDAGLGGPRGFSSLCRFHDSLVVPLSV